MSDGHSEDQVLTEPWRSRPVLVLSLAVVLTVLALAFACWTAVRAHDVVNLRMNRNLSLEEAMGRMRYMDEALTMSAWLGAATGTSHWEKAYAGLEPQLEKTIKEAGELASTEAGRQAIQLTEQANQRLVAMELQAFALIREGRLPEAGALLAGEKYSAAKKLFLQGVEELDLSVEHAAAALRQEQKQFVNASVVSTAVVIPLLMAGWMVVYRQIRRWQALVLQANQKLARDARELEQANRSLDQKVAKRTEHLRKSQAALLNILEDAERSKRQVERSNAELRREIGERKQAEESLRFTQFSVDKASDAILWLGDDARFSYANEAACRMMGYSREELIGKRVFDIDVDIDAEGPEFWEKIKTSGSVTMERRGRRKDGSHFPAEVMITYLQYRGHGYFVADVRDISERMRVESQLREQARMLDLAHDAIWVFDTQQRVLYMNRATALLSEMKPEEIIGRRLDGLIQKGMEGMERAFKETTAAGEWKGELDVVPTSGKRLMLDSRWTLLRDERGNPKGILTISSDVTEKKQLEAQFLRSQRLEAVGSLAGGVAHDLNNILAPIMMVTSLLRDAVKDDESLKLLELVDGSAKRGADIIKQLLAFSRGVDGERTMLRADYLIREVLNLVKPTMPKSITVHNVARNDLWLIRGNATQLHQVLLNLCVNARDAMPEGGELRLTAANVELGEDEAKMIADGKAGSHLMLEVRDTGTGMPPEIQNKIFEPFFTTKTPGKGTGLGLSTALGIIKSHGGFVAVQSELGKGSAFKIFLPASPHGEGFEAQPAPKQAPRGHGELLLVVDDEESIRSTLRQMFSQSGYEVLVARDGTEAVGLFSQNHGRVKLVLTDMMMPYMDGAVLVRTLKLVEPAIKVIAISGLEDDAKRKRLAELGVKTFLPKPCPPDELLKAVHDVLRGEG